MSATSQIGLVGLAVMGQVRAGLTRAIARLPVLRPLQRNLHAR